MNSFLTNVCHSQHSDNNGISFYSFCIVMLIVLQKSKNSVYDLKTTKKINKNITSSGCFGCRFE